MAGKRHPSPRGALLLAIAALALVAGCGGEGSGGNRYTVRASTTMTVASPPLTGARFRAQVNTACRQGWREIAESFARYSGALPPRLTDRARYALAVRKSLLIGLDFQIFDEIRLVGSPPGDARRIERFIGRLQRAVELGEMGRWRAYSAGQVASHFTLFNRRAHRYGLDECLVDAAHLRRVRLGRGGG